MSKKQIAILILPLAVAAYLLACFFGPAAYSFTDEVKITGPYKMAYITLNDIKDWPKWYSWSKEDPSFHFVKGGRQHYVGANFSFESKSMGSGYVELLESYHDSVVTARLQTDVLPGEMKINWQILPEGTRAFFLKVNARLAGTIPFYQRALYLGLPARWNGILRKDLQGIQSYIEQLVQTDFGIKKEPYKEKHYFGILDAVINDRVPQYYAKQLPRVYRFLDSLGITPSGPPAGLIFDWDASVGRVFLMAALPVDKPMPNIRGYTSFTIKPTECLHLEHYGSYATLRHAHTKLSYLMDDSPYVLGAPVIEEYVTSPSQEPDTSKWLTNVYYLFDNTGGYAKTVERKFSLEDVIKMEEAERRENLKKLIQ